MPCHALIICGGKLGRRAGRWAVVEDVPSRASRTRTGMEDSQAYRSQFTATIPAPAPAFWRHVHTLRQVCWLGQCGCNVVGVVAATHPCMLPAAFRVSLYRTRVLLIHSCLALFRDQSAERPMRSGMTNVCGALLDRTNAWAGNSASQPWFGNR